MPPWRCFVKIPCLLVSWPLRWHNSSNTALASCTHHQWIGVTFRCSMFLVLMRREARCGSSCHGPWEAGRQDGSASQVFRETLGLFQPMHCRPGFLSDNSIFTYQVIQGCKHSEIEASSLVLASGTIFMYLKTHTPSHPSVRIKSHRCRFSTSMRSQRRLNQKYIAVSVFPPAICFSADIIPHFEIQQVGSIIGVLKTHTNPAESTTNYHQPPSPAHINLSSHPPLPDGFQRRKAQCHTHYGHTNERVTAHFGGVLIFSRRWEREVNSGFGRFLLSRRLCR